MPSKFRGKTGQTARSSGATAEDGSAASASVLPNWPSLQPLVPTEDLRMEVLLQDQIILIRNLFTPSLCTKYVSFLSSLPLITTPAKAKEGNAVRINDRFEVHDIGFAHRLWSSTGLAHVATGLIGAEGRHTPRLDELTKLWGGELCGLNPRIRVYRYRKGQRFGPHCRSTKMSHFFNETCPFPYECLVSHPHTVWYFSARSALVEIFVIGCCACCGISIR